MIKLSSNQAKGSILTNIIKWREPLLYSFTVLTLFCSSPLIADEPVTEATSDDEIVMPKAVVADLSLLFDMDKLLEQVTEKQLVYVSESHDRYDHHLTQLAVLKAMYEKHPDVVLGMEQFFQPYQGALDRYIAGETDEVDFLNESEYFDRWRFDYRLYRPLLRFAREKGIPVIALNIEKEITHKVASEGIEALTDEEKAKIPTEINRDSEQYSKQLKEIFDLHPHSDKRSFDFFVEAQLVWDEGMAQRAAEHFKANPEGHMVLVAGTGHLAYRTGIPNRLERRTPISSALLINSGGDYLSKDLGDYLVATDPQHIERHGMIGVYLNTEEEGIIKVTKFSKGSDAEEAGMAIEDKIIELDGNILESYGELKNILMDKKPGESVEVKVQRKSLFLSDRVLEFSVELK
jgi:uncharacterized iron-regulated protein